MAARPLPQSSASRTGRLRRSAVNATSSAPDRCNSRLQLRRRCGAVGPRPPRAGRTFSTAQNFVSRLFANRSEQAGRTAMNRTRVGVGCAVALLIGAASAHAQGTVKIGMIDVRSGQFADAGIQLDNGVKTYMKQHGVTVAGKKIEIIRRDVGGPAPDIAKRFAQELIVRDGVDMLAGFLLTPNALAAADVSAQAKKFMVVMNAATSIIITKSPYMIRTSVTLPQVMETFGTWAAKNGLKKCYTMVTDYGPGHDSEAAFQRAFKEAGGEIV